MISLLPTVKYESAEAKNNTPYPYILKPLWLWIALAPTSHLT